MKRSQWLLTALATIALVGQAWAQEQWVGEYAGRLTAANSVPGKIGDPCAVSVTTSDMFGGSLVFEIRDIDKISMETRNIQKALEKKSDSIRLITPGGAGKPAEIVFITLGEDRSLKSLKLLRKWGQQQKEQSAVCGELVKK